MNRILDIGYSFKLGNNDELFTIKEILGKGASSVTYLAECNQTEHVLKECNPLGLHMHRNDKGVLLPDTKLNEDKFKECLERFESGIKKQLAFRMTQTLKNPTSNVQKIYHANGTTYIDMTYFKGCTYDQVKFESLFDVLKRMKALAKIVGGYHEEGYLHLDIKPQNIYAIPETPEFIMMFDFDSVVPAADVKERDILSYTDSWAAPEQKMLSKYKHSICQATDLFAIGEIIFHRVMGRHSNADERFEFSKYTYDREAKIFENVNPRVFGALDNLFHKTLCCAPDNRVKNAKELVALLEEIIPLANPKEPRLVSNFSPTETGFIGRTDKLKEIDQALQSNKIVIARGVGGIGKTCLCREYAKRNAEKYGCVLFVRYNTSIEETFNNEELTILNYDSDETNIEKLCKFLTEDDLLILDNFDDDSVESWDDLDKYFNKNKLRCKCLVTSRINCMDYGYSCVLVDSLSLSESWDLFRKFNTIDYSVEAEETIEKIFRFFDYHTMCVGLISKNLRDSGLSSPLELWKRLQNSEYGIAETSNIPVAEKKDGRHLRKSVEDHVYILFNGIVKLTLEQKTMLYCLSLFANVRFKQKVFASWFNTEITASINQLIQLGWIENHDNKISLHQLIQDVIYNSIGDTISKSCDENLYCSLIQSILNLFDQIPTMSNTDASNYEMLAEVFFRRAHGYSNDYLDFVLSFCDMKIMSALVSKNKLLDIYQHISNPEYRCRVIYLIARKIAHEMPDLFFDEELESSLPIAVEIKEWLNKAKEICDNNVHLLFDLAKALLKCTDTLESKVIFVEDREPGLDLLLDYAIDLFEYLEVLLEKQDTLTIDEKAEIYKFICQFYGGDDIDFSVMYKDEHYRDDDKIQYYYDKINALGVNYDSADIFVDDNDVTVIKINSPDEVIPWDVGIGIDNAINAGNIDKALRLCDELLSQTLTEDIDYETLWSIAKAFESAGQYEKAIRIWQDIHSFHGADISLNIAKCYIKLDEVDLARAIYTKYIDEKICLFSSKKTDIPNSYQVTELLNAICDYNDMCDSNERKDLWKKFEDVYHTVSFRGKSDETINAIRNAFIDYLNNNDRLHESYWEKLKFAYANKVSWDSGYRQAIEYLQELVQLPQTDIWYTHISIYAAILWTQIDYDLTSDHKIALCNIAIGQIEESEADSKFLKMIVNYYLATSYAQLQDTVVSEKHEQQIDYEYVLKYACQIFSIDSKTEVEKWCDIASLYRERKDYIKAAECYQTVLQLATSQGFNYMTGWWWRDAVQNYHDDNNDLLAFDYCKKYIHNMLCAFADIMECKDQAEEELLFTLLGIAHEIREQNLIAEYPLAVACLLLRGIAFTLKLTSCSEQSRVLCDYFLNLDSASATVKAFLSQSNHTPKEIDVWTEICNELLLLEAKNQPSEWHDICERYIANNCYRDIALK